MLPSGLKAAAMVDRGGTGCRSVCSSVYCAEQWDTKSRSAHLLRPEDDLFLFLQRPSSREASSQEMLLAR